MRRINVDEITLFEQLRPPAPADAPWIREAARLRLAAASAPPARPARRVTLAAVSAAALAVAGASYGLTAGLSGTAAEGGSGSPSATAGLTAVSGCPGMYLRAGFLVQVSGTRLTIGSYPRNATVAVSSSTSVTVPVTGTAGDITAGSHVFVTGYWTGTTFTAAKVGIEPSLPVRLGVPAEPKPPVLVGTVDSVRDGSFTVTVPEASGHSRINAKIRVTMADSTQVMKPARAGLRQLHVGANLVVVGRLGPDGVLTASTVVEPSFIRIAGLGQPTKVKPASCSASGIAAAVLAAYA
jgi:hypothetical protein